MIETAYRSLLENSDLYKNFTAECEEILKHKWIESEKVGRDVGYEWALTDWIIRHRHGWRKNINFSRNMVHLKERGIDVRIYKDKREFYGIKPATNEEYKCPPELIEIVGHFTIVDEYLFKKKDSYKIHLIGGYEMAVEGSKKELCMIQ